MYLLLCYYAYYAILCIVVLVILFIKSLFVLLHIGILIAILRQMSIISILGYGISDIFEVAYLLYSLPICTNLHFLGAFLYSVHYFSLLHIDLRSIVSNHTVCVVHKFLQTSECHYRL
jgi:hypothetical protein